MAPGIVVPVGKRRPQDQYSEVLAFAPVRGANLSAAAADNTKEDQVAGFADGVLTLATIPWICAVTSESAVARTSSALA